MVRSGVGELKWSCHIADSIDVGVEGLQEGVGLDRLLRRKGNTKLLKPVARDAGTTTHCAQQLIESNWQLLITVPHDEAFLTLVDLHSNRLMTGEHIDPINAQRGGHQIAYLGILPQH